MEWVEVPEWNTEEWGEYVNKYRRRIKPEEPKKINIEQRLEISPKSTPFTLATPPPKSYNYYQDPFFRASNTSASQEDKLKTWQPLMMTSSATPFYPLSPSLSKAYLS